MTQDIQFIITISIMGGIVMWVMAIPILYHTIRDKDIPGILVGSFIGFFAALMLPITPLFFVLCVV